MPMYLDHGRRAKERDHAQMQPVWAVAAVPVTTARYRVDRALAWT